jgi:hypothetical protein
MPDISDPNPGGRATTSVASQQENGSGNITGSPQQIYVYNSGGASGTFNGVTLPSGVAVNLERGDKAYQTPIPFDATGTTFILHVTY